jgi:hypothetical protein
MNLRRLAAGAAVLAIMVPVACEAGSAPSWNGSWNGVWSGLLNKTEPVSITIADGKVVSYEIRGGQPFGIRYSKVTLNAVAFGDHDNYDVKITKIGNGTANGFAHTSMMGDGSATLTRR